MSLDPLPFHSKWKDRYLRVSSDLIQARFFNQELTRALLAHLWPDGKHSPMRLPWHLPNRGLSIFPSLPEATGTALAAPLGELYGGAKVFLLGYRTPTMRPAAAHSLFQQMFCLVHIKHKDY